MIFRKSGMISTRMLNATIKHHNEKYSSSHPEVVKTLSQSIYADDIVSEGFNEEEVYTLQEDIEPCFIQPS